MLESVFTMLSTDFPKKSVIIAEVAWPATEAGEHATIKIKGAHIHNCSQYAAFVGDGGTLRMVGGAVYDCTQGGVALA
jgi:hypothetical protein